MGTGREAAPKSSRCTFLSLFTLLRGVQAYSKKTCAISFCSNSIFPCIALPMIAFFLDA